MRIEKNNDYLTVYSNVYFNEEQCFCGRPYIRLIAFKKKIMKCWEVNSIGIAILDNDDFHIGLIYETDTKHFESVLHELINWMRDHEQGRSIYMDMWDVFNFFPDCGCMRKLW